ncbi:MAG: DNA polymerase III subunit delta [Deltaproteobacteria bacterium]|nr:DNA polymerase III subunit delta [Deltaproteobacteria bacterium]
MDTKNIKPVYYLFGDEEYLKTETVESVKKAVLAGPMASLNFNKYAVKGLDMSEVVAVANTMPAFSSMRMIVVTGAEGLKEKQTEPLMRYLEKPSASTCLVLISDDEYLRVKKSALHALIKEKGYAKECMKLKRPALDKWVTAFLKERGKTIGSPALERLLNATGTRLADIKGELEKLVLFVGDADAIGDTDVAASVVGVNEASAFDLASAVIRKDRKAALRIALTLVDEDMLAVVGAMAWQIRAVLRTAAASARGLDKWGIVREAKVPLDNIPLYLQLSKQASEAELLGLLVRLREVILGVKSNDKLPGPVAMSYMALALSSGRGVAVAGGRA